MEILEIMVPIIKILVAGGILIISGIVSFVGVPISVLFLVLAVLHFWMNGAGVFSEQQIIVLTILTILSVFLDNLVLMLGLKKTNASKRGYIGAIIGSVGGIVSGSLPGLFLFTAIGAMVGELSQGKTKNEAFKAGIGATLSLIFGSLLRAVLSLIVVGIVIRGLLFG